MTAGVHCLEKNCKNELSHSFRPVLHFFGKQHENTGSMLMMIDALSLMTKRYGGYELIGDAAPHSGCCGTEALGSSPVGWSGTLKEVS